MARPRQRQRRDRHDSRDQHAHRQTTRRANPRKARRREPIRRCAHRFAGTVMRNRSGDLFRCGAIALIAAFVSIHSDAELSSIKADLISRGIKYCIGAYVDLHGGPKGKVVPVSHFESFAKGSELYTGYALDGVGQSPNDDEIASVPDLRRGVRLPWQPGGMWYPGDLGFYGKPYDVSTRVVFGRVLEQARQMGFTFNLGIEC